jgi:hypothetical protein
MPQVTPRLALVALMLGIVPARAQDRRPLRLTGITQEGPPQAPPVRRCAAATLPCRGGRRRGLTRKE